MWPEKFISKGGDSLRAVNFFTVAENCVVVFFSSRFIHTFLTHLLRVQTADHPSMYVLAAYETTAYGISSSHCTAASFTARKGKRDMRVHIPSGMCREGEGKTPVTPKSLTERKNA